MAPLMFVFPAVLFTSFCSLLLGLVVLVKNKKNAANITFSLFALMLAIWLVVNYFGNDLTLNNEMLSLFSKQATFFIAVIGLYFLMLFSFAFTKIAASKFTYIAIISGFIMAAVSYLCTTKMIVGKPYIANGVKGVEFGPLTIIFVIFLVGALLITVANLLISVRRQKGMIRARTLLMAYSIFLALSITLTTDLFFPLVYKNYTFSQLGPLALFIIIAGFSYAIVKQRLFDIRLVVARSVTYLLLLISLGTLYGFITFNIGGLIFHSSQVGLAQRVFNVNVAILLAFTFQPLRRLFEEITDKIFYRGHYDPQQLVNKISQIMASEIELVSLSRRVRSVLATQMRVSNVNVVVLNNNKVFVEGGRYVVSKLEGLAEDLSHIKTHMIITEDEPDGDRKEMLKHYGIGIFAMLRTKEEKIGYLLFGEKLNGDIYTYVDRRVIETIADQLAVAVQNAKSYVQVKKFNQTLRTKVNDATHQLKDANESLRQLDKVKDDFISMTSHQLGEPMSAIHGYLVQVLGGMYGPLREEQQKALELTTNRVRLTKGLVADLLDISRMEVGKFQIIPKPTDIQKVVEEEIDALKFKISEKEVDLKFIKPNESIPPINIDEPKTRQVIMNLIDNALYYAAKGHVEVSLEAVGKNVVFQVVDDGIGVPKSQQDKLFKKFYRADNAKNVRPDGTGIGLYLAKKVVEDQGGSIIFSSEKGEGSTFGFRLPMRVS